MSLEKRGERRRADEEQGGLDKTRGRTSRCAKRRPRSSSRPRSSKQGSDSSSSSRRRNSRRSPAAEARQRALIARRRRRRRREQRRGKARAWSGESGFFFLALLLLRVIATHAPTLGRAAVVGRRRRAARLRLDVARVTVRALALSSSCVAATYSCENRPSPRPIRALRPASTSPIARGRVAFWHAPRPHQARACREPWRLLVALPSTRSLAPANQRLRVPRRRRQDSKEGL